MYLPDLESECIEVFECPLCLRKYYEGDECPCDCDEQIAKVGFDEFMGLLPCDVKVNH